MPHIILEYTDNLENYLKFNELFNKVHQSLSRILKLDINLCRSRAIKHSKFLIGDGNQRNSHIHVTLLILEGKPLDIKNEIAEILLEAMRLQLQQYREMFNIQITLEIKDIQEASYFKEILKSSPH